MGYPITYLDANATSGTCSSRLLCCDLFGPCCWLNSTSIRNISPLQYQCVPHNPMKNVLKLVKFIHDGRTGHNGERWGWWFWKMCQSHLGPGILWGPKGSIMENSGVGGFEKCNSNPCLEQTETVELFFDPYFSKRLICHESERIAACCEMMWPNPVGLKLLG